MELFLQLILLLIFLLFIFIVYKINQQIPIWKGRAGEAEVIKKLNKLDSTKYTVLNDLFFKTGDKSAQIDHVIISNYGIFVIETKNYNGKIYGSENKDYWTVYLRKFQTNFYNPIKQNRGHIYALKNILNEYPSFKYISIINFTNKSIVKVKSNTPVVQTKQLLRTIKSYDEEYLSNELKEIILQKLLEQNIPVKNRK